MMNPKEKEVIKASISAEIIKLERSVKTLLDLADSEVQSDANDWFTSKESNPSKEINEFALAKARKRIILLNNLLKRVDSSEFGICEKCKKPIPFGRLKVVPTATRCVSC